MSVIHQTASESLVEFTGTGAVMGWSLPTAPQMQAGWPSSIDQHDTLAKNYFLQLGVTEGELGPVTHFSGHSRGAPTSNPEAEQTTDLGYSTSFRRVVSGFEVIDSRASVQLNAQGQSVAFHFFWPSVPSSAVALAQSLQSTLSQSWSPAPGAMGAGWSVTSTHVVIHHGLAGDASLHWVATIRLELGNGAKTSYIDCDANGQRVYPYGGTVPSPQQRP